MPAEFDRSRAISYQTCPRKRYYEFHHLGKGLQRKSKGLPLVFGGAFHEGAEELLRGRVEEAVQKAQSSLMTSFAEKGVAIETETDDALKYGVEEQLALVEGLTRAWGLARLPEFLSNFNVIEIEREGRANLTPDLTLLYRPDALVQDKLSGDHYIVSWKSTSSYGKRNIDSARVDMQSMSEVWGRLNDSNPPPSIEGVLYIFATKGQRRLDKWDNLFKQDSKLIYGWKRVKPLDEFEDGWSWTYSFAKEDGTGDTNLGKGWKKQPIWREYPGGVKQWVQDLHESKIYPRHINALDEIFPQSLPVERRKDEVERWRRQITAQEEQVSVMVAEMETYHSHLPNFEESLDRFFPQFTHNCFTYNSPCAFLEVCHGGVAAEPGELYTIRSANHPESGDEDE